MDTVLDALSQRRRPRLLIRASRFGSQMYRRKPHLQRLLGYVGHESRQSILERLMVLEEMLEEKRKTADAEYSVSRHVEVLSALMGEAALLLPEADAPPQEKASGMEAFLLAI